MTDTLDWIARSGAMAKGHRPDYLGDSHQERMLSMVMALIAEVSVVRERIDTIERLLDAKGTISRADIESYAPDLETGKERNRIVRAYLARVMRGLQQELEATANPQPAMEELVERLTT